MPRPFFLAMITFSAAIAIALLGQSAHAIETANTPADRDGEFFRAEVRPIFVEQCYSCHNVDKAHGSLKLESQTGALAGGESGKKIAYVPLEKNELWQRVTSQLPFERMPLESPRLSDHDLEVLRRWAEQGAPWPADIPPPPKANLIESPWWVTAIGWIDPLAAWIDSYQAYFPAFYLVLAVLCVAAITQRWKQSTEQAPWKRRICRVTNATFFLSCAGLIVADLFVLHVRELNRRQAKLQASLEATQKDLQRATQQFSPTVSGEPNAYYLPQPNRIGGSYYRGNDERNEALFNGGAYLTCTFVVSLCDGDHKPLVAGDAVPPGPMLVKLDILRAPFAAESLFSPNVFDATFLSALKPHEKMLNPSKQLSYFTIVKEGEQWTASTPIAEIKSPDETRTIAGKLYLYNGGKRDNELEGAPSYAIKYELKLAAGKLAKDSDLRMGVVMVPGNFAIPPDGKESITGWFDTRPLPEITGGNTSDPKLLGIEPHVERLGLPTETHDDTPPK